MFISFQRVIKNGAVNFYRNGWLSTATVSILVLTLFVVAGLMTMSVITTFAVDTLQNKIDITVYFSQGVGEDKILKIVDDLSKRGETSNVDYISKEDALLKFKERHKNNSLLLQSLSELDENPLQSSLNIKAKDPSKFASIVSFLDTPEYKEVIDKVNYYEKQTTIAKLTNFVKSVRQIGMALIVTFALVAFLVSFNAIRMAIYSAREEIAIMRLVGASNWFIRGPFIIEGVLYGLISAVITTVLFYPLLSFAAPYVDAFMPGTDIYGYFKSNFFQFFAIIAGIGVVLGALSSFVAVRRYLKN